MIAIEREKEREYASKEVKVISYLHTYRVEICIRIATVRCVLTIANERGELYEGNSRTSYEDLCRPYAWRTIETKAKREREIKKFR